MKQSISLILMLSLVFGLSAQVPTKRMYGPLRVSENNPRYFTDDQGKAVYLTGSHTWNNLVEMKSAEGQKEFDYTDYLKWMKKYNFNFIRLWAWEILNWDTSANKESNDQNLTVYPHPWARTGPGNALDGKPKFDLSKLNDAYFNRIRERVEMAGEYGIYLSIMLFEGWGIQFSPNAYENHPFHPANNINGIVGDVDGDGKGLEIHSLANADVLAIQKEYVKGVIDLVNEFDNVLYEISNESHGLSTDWQCHMINFIKGYEQNLPKQHPVGLTFQHRGGNNESLFQSPADWISPNREGGYRDNPPVSDGRKIIISDTDHLWGIGGDESWVWKSFLRGLNPIFMDPYDGKVLTVKSYDSARVEPLRKSLGYTLLLANRVDLISMKPDTVLASSAYCLANKGTEYLIYLPKDKTVEVDLSGIAGDFTSEWFNPELGKFKESTTVKGGGKVSITSPYGTANVILHLLKNSRKSD